MLVEGANDAQRQLDEAVQASYQGRADPDDPARGRSVEQDVKRAWDEDRDTPVGYRKAG